MPLLDTAALRDLVDNREIVVLDVRWSLTEGADRRAYLSGHIPGAVFVDLDVDMCGTPGNGGRHPLPSPEHLQERLRTFGIHDDSTIVVYDGGDMMAASRAWWTLRWAGLADVRVLDTGFAAWDGACTTVEPVVAPGTVTVRPGNLPVLDADAAATLAESGTLLDVRARPRFDGDAEPIDPVAGHIPGARHAPIDAIVRQSGGFSALPDLMLELADYPANSGVYCGSGIAASRAALAMHATGRPVPPVYIGSWSDWVSDPSRPVATARS